MFAHICLCIALLTSCHSIWTGQIWNFWNLLQDLDSFIYKLLCFIISFLLYLCLGSLSFCMTQFQQSFSCQTDCLNFDSRILWYSVECTIKSMNARWTCPVSAQQAQTVNLPPMCLTASMMCCVVMFVLWPNISTLVIFGPLPQKTFFTWL